MPKTRQPLWREPLVHFLLAGIAIFAINSWRGPDTSPQSQRILISTDEIERMALLWSRSWGRPPSDEELQGMVRDYIKEEVYYREALKLGLDVNDTAIRRRLRQKMEFLILAEIDASDPDRATLEAWYGEQGDRYVEGPKLSFEQIYFDAGNTSAREAAQAALARDPQADVTGDAISLPRRFENTDLSEVRRAFGKAFAASLQEQPQGQWVGPVSSGFGQHLVRIDTITPARQPGFDAVAAQVRRDYLADARARTEAEAYAAMRDRYDIEIEGIDP